ncbi:MAG: DNA mismatch repair endonuclease MutL [Mariprofundaceae bacterium]|nr:DNA mismatch repair endonuclease MutL [Mariprofundaceae bacterium]
MIEALKGKAALEHTPRFNPLSLPPASLASAPIINDDAPMSHPTIHILPAQVANQIAAGEVVERPASAVKELMENSLDAGATQIQVRIQQAGKKRIEIDDNGCGMSPEDAACALKRHATSKIETSADLHCIASHGFRGEALPSIASVSRFRMLTCLADSDEGIELKVDGGLAAESRPAAPRKGTKIEILDLFLNTPARLNFMRTDKTEEAAIVEVVKALALSHPKVAITLEFDGKKRFNFVAQSEKERVLSILGKDFAKNHLQQHLEHENIHVSAFLGLPTFHHRDSTRMVFLVNGRVIRDKQLIAALRAGYRDVMFHDRYPIAVVRLEIDPADVDVNVHPSKKEVRFKSPQQVFAAVVACVRLAIERMGQSVSSTTTQQALQSMHAETNTSTYQPQTPVAHSNMPRFQSERMPTMSHERTKSGTNIGASSSANIATDVQRVLFSSGNTGGEVGESAAVYHVDNTPDLGQPLAQVHQCYVLAQTNDGVVLVDQHAAHERMTYEKIKAQLTGGDIAVQMLLSPEPVHVDANTMAWLADYSDTLERFGVQLDLIDEHTTHIKSIPAMLGKESPVALVEELIDACMLLGAESEADRTGLGRILERWLGNRACKASIKAGRTLSHEEQINLLREMEKTPNIAQCNHGRPTYVKLSLHDLDRLFGRKE